MGLSPTTQWTLVASGLIAHADHVVSGEECERLMTLVDEETDGDAYAQWLAIVSDPQRLEAMLEQLELPPAEDHPRILEDAWLMSVVDGERVEAERAVLERLAARLGVERSQLDRWSDGWTTTQLAYAETATVALAHVLGDGEALGDEDRGAVEAFLHTLPITHEQRAQLAARGLRARPRDEVERRVRALPKTQQRDLVRRLAAASAGRGDNGLERWRSLGSVLGLRDDELDAIGDEG